MCIRDRPHWTISEFFNELEKFLGVITVVYEQSKIVRFVELNSYFSNPDKEIISYTELLHEFTAEINEEKGDKDVTSGNIGYDLPSTSVVASRIMPTTRVNRVSSTAAITVSLIFMANAWSSACLLYTSRCV